MYQFNKCMIDAIELLASIRNNCSGFNWALKVVGGIELSELVEVCM